MSRQRMAPIYETDETTTKKPQKTKFRLPWEVLGSGIQLRNIFGDFFNGKIAGNEMDEHRRQTEIHEDNEYELHPIQRWGSNSGFDSKLYSTRDVVDDDATHSSLNDSSEFGRNDPLPDLNILPAFAAASFSNPKFMKAPSSSDTKQYLKPYSLTGEYRASPPNSSETFTDQSQVSGERLQREKPTVVKIPISELSSWLPPALQPPNPFQIKRENDPCENLLIPRIQPPIAQLQESKNSSEIPQNQQQNYNNDLYRTIEVPNKENYKEVAAQNVIQSTDPQIQHFSTVPQPPPHFFVSPLPPPPPPLQQQQQQQLWHPPPQEQLWHHHPHPPAVHLLPQTLQPHPPINRQPTFFSQMPFSIPFFGNNNQHQVQVVSHPPSFVPHGMYVSHPRISSFPPPHQPPPFQHPYGNFVQPQPPYHMQSHQQPWPELSEMTKMIRRITP